MLFVDINSKVYFSVKILNVNNVKYLFLRKYKYLQRDTYSIDIRYVRLRIVLLVSEIRNS